MRGPYPGGGVLVPGKAGDGLTARRGGTAIQEMQGHGAVCERGAIPESAPCRGDIARGHGYG